MHANLSWFESCGEIILYNKIAWFFVVFFVINLCLLPLSFQVQKCHVWHFAHWGSWWFWSEGQIYGSWDGKSPASFPGKHFILASGFPGTKQLTSQHTPWWQTLKRHFQPIGLLKKQRKQFLMKSTAVDTFVLMNLYEQTYCMCVFSHWMYSVFRTSFSCSTKVWPSWRCLTKPKSTSIYSSSSWIKNSMENDKVKGGKATKRKQIVPSDCAEFVEQNEFSQITRDGAGQYFVPSSYNFKDHTKI